MTTYKTLEIWVVVDSDGDCAVGLDREAADEQYTETVADFDQAEGIRRVKVTVRVPVPTLVEIVGEAVEISEV